MMPKMHKNQRLWGKLIEHQAGTYNTQEDGKNIINHVYIIRQVIRKKKSTRIYTVKEGMVIGNNLDKEMATLHLIENTINYNTAIKASKNRYLVKIK